MDHPLPDPPLVRHDRLASAIGNESLLGVGYLLLGRRAWAVGTTLVTIVFLVLLGSAVREVWFEVTFLVWWALLVAHGWYLAGQPAPPSGVRWPRVTASLITIPVLVGIGYVRFDAARIEDSITAARADGDCGKAQSALDRIWFGHYVVDGPMAVRSERTARTCARLRDAARALDLVAFRPDAIGLRSGYQELGAVLTDMPDHDRMVSTVLDGFLGGLPSHNPCDIVQVTDWLRQRPATNNLLDRSAEVVPKLAPAALVDCADKRADASDWAAAKTLYQQLLDQYPGNELAVRARTGITQATQNLELGHLATLGNGYCKTPAVYSGAAPYAKGATNPAVIYNTDTYDDSYLKRLPTEWQADKSHAVIVVCISKREAGAAVRTCRYRETLSGRVRNITFTKMAYPVKAYELRTGNVVFDATVQIGGAACPQNTTIFGESDHMLVEPDDSDIRAAFAPVFTP